MEQRTQRMKEIAERTFDVLVIGGGATGAGVALDAATRGLSVALVERYDFSSGTSSRSTKLVHGGVRYLEQAIKHADRSQFRLVREALKERATLLKNAPHLARSLPLLTPLYSALELPYYFTGLKLYDMLAGRANLEPSRLIGRAQAMQRFPMLKRHGLKGAVEYHDGQFDDARMNMALVLTAAKEGATVANYVDVVELTKEGGKVSGAVVQETLAEGGARAELRAKVVVNATGPFVDSIRHLDEPDTPAILHTSSGVHIVLPKRFSPPGTGLLIPRTEDGRVLFLLPWLGHTLVGTTDNDAPIEDDPQASGTDVAYILRHIRQYFDLPVSEDDVLSAWSGLRPLVQPEAVAAAQAGAHDAGVPHHEQSTSSLSRDHTVLVSPSGLVTITGGKWTTYRRMAEDTVDTAIRVGGLAPAKGSGTEELKLVGAEGFTVGGEAALAEAYGLAPDVAFHLHHAYGDRAGTVAELAASQGLGGRLAEGHPFLEAEVPYARDVEFARTVDDVLERRTRLGFLDRAAADAVKGRVSELLQS